MKLNLFERSIACCLLGAATLAIASGMSKIKIADDGDATVRFVAEESEMQQPTEQSIGKLVEAVAEASAEEKNEKREALKEALSQIFRTRTEAQQTQIAEMRERLEEIESQLKKRLSLEDQIVERRVGQLLGEKDELSWDHKPSIDLDAEGRDVPARDLLRRAFSFEFPTEFPKAYPADVEKLVRDKENVFRETLLKNKKLDEEKQNRFLHAAREAREVARKAQEAFAKDREKGSLDRARVEKDFDIQEQKLRALGDLRDAVNGPFDSTKALKARIEVMREQSRQLEKQLEELSKQTPKEVVPR